MSVCITHISDCVTWEKGKNCSKSEKKTFNLLGTFTKHTHYLSKNNNKIKLGKMNTYNH